MQIVYKRLSEIHPYQNNPRKNDNAVDKVMASIKAFGFKVPIVIDGGGAIVTGHTRYKAAQKMNMEEVPCIEADDLTEEQINAFRLADNKTSEFSEWDFELLEQELENIFNLDIEQFGFTDSEMGNVDWNNIPDLHEDNYREPKPSFIKCPCCGHINEVSQFEKVKDEDIS